MKKFNILNQCISLLTVFGNYDIFICLLMLSCLDDSELRTLLARLKFHAFKANRLPPSQSTYMERHITVIENCFACGHVICQLNLLAALIVCLVAKSTTEADKTDKKKMGNLTRLWESVRDRNGNGPQRKRGEKKCAQQAYLNTSHFPAYFRTSSRVFYNFE